MDSIMGSERGTCYLCGCNAGYERHHAIYGSANRKMSEKYGLVVWLCPECHRSYKHGVHGMNKAADDWLHEQAQAAFEETHTREEFREIFGKSWL